MKTVLLALGLFVISSSAIAAGGFDVEKDGVIYRCEEKGGSNGNSVVTCAAKAYKGPFSKEEAIELCAGATSDLPAECALKAYAGPYSRAEALQLCKRARTLGPVECAQEAYHGPFSRDEAIRLCERNGDLERAKCAITAYKGPYSREEAIKICSGPNAHLILRSLELIASSPELQLMLAPLKQK